MGFLSNNEMTFNRSVQSHKFSCNRGVPNFHARKLYRMIFTMIHLVSISCSKGIVSDCPITHDTIPRVKCRIPNFAYHINPSIFLRFIRMCHTQKLPLRKIGLRIILENVDHVTQPPLTAGFLINIKFQFLHLTLWFF